MLEAARDRIIHGYDPVGLDVVWDVAATEMPVPVQELERLRALMAAPPPS